MCFKVHEQMYIYLLGWYIFSIKKLYTYFCQWTSFSRIRWTGPPSYPLALCTLSIHSQVPACSCLFLFNAHYLRVTRHVSFCQIYHHSINRFLRRFCMYILCTYPTYLLMYLCHVSLLCSWHQYLWHHLVMYQFILILSSVCFGLLSDVQFLRPRPNSFGTR